MKVLEKDIEKVLEEDKVCKTGKIGENTYTQTEEENKAWEEYKKAYNM